MFDRERLTEKIADLGERVNEVRTLATQNRIGFIAGLLRGAEQSVQLAYDALSNPDVQLEHLEDGY